MIIRHKGTFIFFEKSDFLAFLLKEIYNFNQLPLSFS